MATISVIPTELISLIYYSNFHGINSILQYRSILRILLIQEANAVGMTDIVAQGFNPGK